ncbi:uncharacterized protein VTP21DRAFT_5325 [Calcarisporiella thermophila]|uniref:uncharacterized protein n=1 Tax=Calcarisporiella thermophila TaxID=911321 RepID=UPI003742999B
MNDIQKDQEFPSNKGNRQSVAGISTGWQCQDPGIQAKFKLKPIVDEEQDEDCIDKPILRNKKTFINVGEYLGLGPEDVRVYRLVIRDLMKLVGVNTDGPYTSQDPQKITKVVRMFKKEFKSFPRTRRDWAVREWIKQIIHNRRAYESGKVKDNRNISMHLAEELESYHSSRTPEDSDVENEVNGDTQEHFNAKKGAKRRANSITTLRATTDTMNDGNPRQKKAQNMEKRRKRANGVASNSRRPNRLIPAFESKRRQVGISSRADKVRKGKSKGKRDLGNQRSADSRRNC